MPDTQQTASDFVIANISITGCPPPAKPLPVVRMGGITVENVSMEHKWTVERSLSPQVRQGQ